MSDDPRPWIDRANILALWWNGSALAGSGLVLEYRLGLDAPRGATVLGMGWEAWGLLHWCLGLTMVALVTIHLWRHRRWLWGALCRQRWPAMLLVLAIALLLLFGPLLSPA
jgi:hypothetical protein